MKLWLIRPREGLQGKDDPWGCWYDKAFGFVVRAETEERARELAAKEKGDEGKEAWLNSQFSCCEELKEMGEEGIIISDFHAA